MKNLIILVVSIILIGGGFYYLNRTVGERQVVDAPLEADSLAGVWQSIEDPNFVRTIYENGGYSDLYEGEEVSNGPWVTFMTDAAPAEFPYPLEEDVMYLELMDEEGSLYFKVVEKTEEKLTLIYLDRGGVLEFIRVEQ
mgnify:CR=1 FL=1|tara:strand:- start:9760 stop:10176 length:417 start_codon:yes stop_codon:yes gene_type:complete